MDRAAGLTANDAISAIFGLGAGTVVGSKAAKMAGGRSRNLRGAVSCVLYQDTEAEKPSGRERPEEAGEPNGAGTRVL